MQQNILDKRRTGRTTRIFEEILRKRKPTTFFIFPTREIAKHSFNYFRLYLEDRLQSEKLAFRLPNLLIRIQLKDSYIDIYFKGADNLSYLDFRGRSQPPSLICDHTIEDFRIRFYKETH